MGKVLFLELMSTEIILIEILVLIKFKPFFACYLIYIACFEPGNILKKINEKEIIFIRNIRLELELELRNNWFWENIFNVKIRNI